MSQVGEWLIQGVPIGCIYGLVAIGLVLTYKTSGVFNLAFSGQAFFCAWFWYDRIQNHGWAPWLGFVVTVFVVAPLVGLLLDRALFRYMRTASWQVKLVTALGLLVSFPEIVKAIYSQTPATFVPSLAPTFIGRDQYKGFDVFGQSISPDAMMIIIFTVAAVLIFGALFRFTAIGLQMRAVVESPRMVELAGVDSDRVSMVAWMLSSMVAGLAGIILSPEQTEVNGTTYQILIIGAIAAASVGRFISIPWTLVGAIGIGVGGRALQDIIGGTGIADDVRPSFPFLVLLLLLVFWWRLREGKAAADPLSGVDPPPPAMAHEYKDEELRKTTKVIFPVFMLGFLVVMMTLVSGPWVQRLSLAFATAVVFLSITIITGLGGQVSLATATFAAVGAFAVPHLFNDLDVPVIPAMFIGALAAAALGAIFVLLIDGLPLLIGKITGRPPTRLAGLYLSLATLAFALMMDKTVFRRESVIGGPQGIEVPRPDALNGDREWFLVVFAVFAIVGFFVILIRKGTTGKALAALRGSDPAAASIGINATSLRIKLFALSAGVAGLGGALLTLQSENANPNEVISLLGLVWVVLIVTLGSRTVDGAANAAIGFVVFAWLLEALGFQSSFAIVFFGLGAITYARHPEGVVEFQTRRSIVQTIRQRALGVRAKQLKSEGALPKEYRPVRAVSLPVLIGPALYFAYIVIGSVFEDGWLSVRSPTILFFIVPSLVFGLAWMFVTCLRLERDGGVRFGWLRLVAGGVVGGLLGVWFDSKGWPLRGSLADCVLVGIPAGIAVVGFFLLPVNVQRIVKARNWLTTPIAWQAGRAPALFVLFGAFLFQRTIRTGETSGSVFETGAAPSGWPVFFVVCVFVIVWVQWVAGVQAAVNELAIGGEGFVPPEGKAYVAEREAAAPAPTGGAE